MQIQESLTTQIADTIADVLDPHGVAVVIEAAHQGDDTGDPKAGVSMVTSRMLGVFREDATPVESFYYDWKSQTHNG